MTTIPHPPTTRSTIFLNEDVLHHVVIYEWAGYDEWARGSICREPCH